MTENDKKKFLIIISLIISFLLVGCTSMTGIEQYLAGDWDWALDYAYQVLENAGYNNNEYFVSDFYVENLTREGFFDTEMLFPVWTIYFEQGDLKYLLVRIHPDGDFFIDQFRREHGLNGPLKSTYTSEDVRSWITIASYTYHRLFNAFDDVSYGVSCHTRTYKDKASVYLLNADYESLCTVILDAKRGTVEYVRPHHQR